MEYQIPEKLPYQKVMREHIPEIIQRYVGGESSEKIAEDFPFGKDVVLRVLRDFNVPIKTRKENRFSMGFTINKQAFLDFKEPEAAYFYGWLLTDGNIRKTKYGHNISIEIGLKDKAVLDSLYMNTPENLRLERKYNLYVGRYYNGIN